MDDPKSLAPAGGAQAPSVLERFRYLEDTGALDLVTQLRNENRELEMLLNDAAALFGRNNVEGLIDYVISRLLDRFIPMHLVFIIEPPRGGRVKTYCYRNMKPDKADFPLESYAALKDFFTRTPYPMPFAEVERRLGPRCFGPEVRRFMPEMILPLRGIGGVHGIVLFGKKIVGGGYSDVEIMYVDRFTRFLSIAIQNCMHLESSITDAKTGLFNHFYFMKRLEEELARIGRHRSQAGIIMLDVDHFKRFNDDYGHLAGDEVLVEMARTLKSQVRSEDVAARFGGEEFCVLAIECGEERLLEMAERIRVSIASLRVDFKSISLSVTVSLGCCLLDPGRALGPEGFLEKADRALYVSKSTGRNRTTLYRFGLLGRAGAARLVAIEAGAPA